jgi:hypothetical protein
MQNRGDKIELAALENVIPTDAPDFHAAARIRRPPPYAIPCLKPDSHGGCCAWRNR